MPNSKNYDLDIDTTLGGSNASDYVIPSQKAIKAYVDNNSGGGGSSTDVQINGTSITSQGVANIITESAYNASSNKIATMSDIPAAGANTDLSNLTATGENKFADKSLSNVNAVNPRLLFNNGLKFRSEWGFIGFDTDNSQTGEVLNITDINSSTDAPSTNSAVTLQINGQEFVNGSTNLINDNRISSNIARTSQIPSTSGFEQTTNKVTSLSSSSTDTQYPSAKCVYDKLVDVVRQKTTDTINLYGWGDISEQFFTISEPSVVTIGDPVFNSNGTYIGYVSIVNNTNPSLIKIQVISGTTTSGTLIHYSSLDTTFSRSTLTDNNSNVLNITQAGGQWVGLSEGVSVSSSTATGTRNFSVAKYLPNDNYNYEVILSAYGASSNTSRMSVKTSLTPEIFVCGTSANGRYDANTFTLPVGADRIITQIISSASFSSNAHLILYAYRRIGTNS